MKISGEVLTWTGVGIGLAIGIGLLAKAWFDINVITILDKALGGLL